MISDDLANHVIPNASVNLNSPHMSISGTNAKRMMAQIHLKVSTELSSPISVVQ